MADDDRPPSTQSTTDGGSSRHWYERLFDAISGEPQDKEQLLELLRDAERRELIDSEAFSMLEGVLGVSEIQVRDIMVPRSHMVVVDRASQPQDLLPMIIQSGHSRFPVIGEDRDQVVGILLAKDLLRYFADPQQGFDIRECLRPAVYIPESKRLNVLLKEFRANRNHMAIVVDEYGGTAGLVTIEDVLEQIVGEIDDETDVEEEQPIQEQARGRYLVHAHTPVDEFNDYFGTELSDEDFDTIGGLVMSSFGRLPRRGETLRMDPFTIRVVRADRRRIHSLEVTRLPAAARPREADQA